MKGSPRVPTRNAMNIPWVVFALAVGLVAAGAEGKKAKSVNIPSTYSVQVSYKMPYIGLEEPVFVVEDMTAGLQFLSFYDGSNTFRFNASGVGSANETAFEIIPVIDHLDCFAHPTMGYRTVMPDPSPFVLRDFQNTVDGILCDVWELVQIDLNETSQLQGEYTLYTDAATGLIVRFAFLGHNTLFGGSHNDEYRVDYRDWVLGDAIDRSVFPLPAEYDVEQCIANSKKPREGELMIKPWRNPRDDLTLLFPESHAENVARFREYKLTYGKAYAEVTPEHRQRHVQFHWNLRFIHSINRQGRSYWLDVNHLADWTKTELKTLSGLTLVGESEDEKYANYSHKPTMTEDQLPKEVNWTANGAVTAVKDQGSCGSCWSFGTTGTIEGQLFRKTGKLVRLSQQELMDCSWPFENRACNGGEDGRSYRWMMNTTGGTISTEESYGPYLNAPGWCHWDKAQAGARINGYVSIPKGDLLAFNDALTNVGPLSVAVDATQPTLYFYKGGLYDDPKCGKELDHIVLATGFMTYKGQRYTVVKNSWSTHWGQNGYILITQHENCCGLANQATYPLLADQQPMDGEPRSPSAHLALNSELVGVKPAASSFRVNVKTVA